MGRKRLTDHSRWSEKALEAYLVRRVHEELGGLCLKYYSHASTGWPDRLCILPGGRTFWVELKSTGCRPTAMQRERMETLCGLGVRAEWADTRERIDAILVSYE